VVSGGDQLTSRYRYRLDRYQSPSSRIQVDTVHAPGKPAPPWFPEPEPGTPTSGTQGHGLSGYRWGRCRCDICRQAKRVSNAKYRSNISKSGVDISK
jgi:hypothetical protein